MKAILLPYFCDQNEPSRPIAKIIDLPNEIKPRDLYLKLLFVQHVNQDAKHSEIKVRKGKRGDYGDIVVEGPYETFLFVTLVDDRVI